jgi:hypothetical protein
MARTKQTARVSTGGKQPRKALASRPAVPQKKTKYEHNADRKKFNPQNNSPNKFSDVSIACHDDGTEQNKAEQNLITMLNSQIIPFGRATKYVPFDSLANDFEGDYALMDNDRQSSYGGLRRPTWEMYQDGELANLDKKHAKQYLEDIVAEFKKVTWCFVGTRERPQGVVCTGDMVGHEWTCVTSHAVQKLVFWYGKDDYEDVSYYIALQIGEMNIVVGALVGHPTISTNFFHFLGSDGSSSGYTKTDKQPQPDDVIDLLQERYHEYLEEY